MEKFEKNTDKDIKTLQFGSTIREISLLDDEALKNLKKPRKLCNCSAKLIIRKGSSLDKRYSWYPNWSVEITGEDGHTITWTPTKKLFFNLIDEFFVHESLVDMTRNRNSDTEIYKNTLDEIVLRVQKQLKDFDIPEVYKKQEMNNED